MKKFIVNILRAKHKKCVWRGSCLYETSCGHEFYDANEDGGLVTDWATYCPYCSGEIKTKFTEIRTNNDKQNS